MLTFMVIVDDLGRIHVQKLAVGSLVELSKVFGSALMDEEFSPVVMEVGDTVDIRYTQDRLPDDRLPQYHYNSTIGSRTPVRHYGVLRVGVRPDIKEGIPNFASAEEADAWLEARGVEPADSTWTMGRGWS